MSDSAFTTLLTHTCDITRRILSRTTPDKWGAAVESFSDITSSEKCLFQQMKETIEFSRRGEKFLSNTLIFMEITANIQEDDILTYRNKKYRVVGVEDAGGQGHHYEVYVISLEN
jgi:hypothetical protein